VARLRGRRRGVSATAKARSGFPWLTIRAAGNARYQPRFPNRTVPTVPTLVRTPSGDELDAADPALARTRAGVRVIKQDRGVFDTDPLSLRPRRPCRPLPPGRARPWRPDGSGPTPGGGGLGPGFPEDTWVGRVLRVGPCGCGDPVTALRDGHH